MCSAEVVKEQKIPRGTRGKPSIQRMYRSGSDAEFRRKRTACADRVDAALSILHYSCDRTYSRGVKAGAESCVINRQVQWRNEPSRGARSKMNGDAEQVRDVRNVRVRAMSVAKRNA